MSEGGKEGTYKVWNTYNSRCYVYKAKAIDMNMKYEGCFRWLVHL